MNNSIQYIVILLICFALCVYMAVFALLHTKRDKVRSYYVHFVYAIAGQCLFDLIWKFSEGRTIRANTVFSYTVNILYFICAMLMAYFWFLYSEKIQGSHKTRMERTISLVVFNVPFAFLFILILTTSITHKVFYIQNGIYHRGDLYILTVIIPAVYIVYTSVKALVRLSQKKYYIMRVVNLFISLYAVILLIFQTTQIITNGESNKQP